MDNNHLDKIFDKYLNESKIFKKRDFLRHDYIPNNLPHRSDQIEKIGNILAPSLKREKVSNIFLQCFVLYIEIVVIKSIEGNFNKLYLKFISLVDCKLIKFMK